MVEGDTIAKIIPLHKNSNRSAAQRRASQRTAAARRHPSVLANPGGRASAEQIAAAVHEMDQRRGAAGVTTAEPSVNEPENLPRTGAALVVANPGGVLPLAALMLSVAVHDEHPAHRDLRMLAADLVFDLPVIGSAARKTGHTMACATDAHQLLAAGELTAVFPEGFKGLGKRYKDRYKLQRFGRGGFVSAALRTKAPIVPCSIVGSEEIYPMMADVKLLARLLGVPYFPITPLFPLAGPAGLVPLPSKWHIAFGAPIETTNFGVNEAEDPMITFELTDQVRETIQQTLYRLLAGRRNLFFG